ncbi:hypothetical protein [Motilibacter aurantiacus]|nr:hypothetical protein [Motilibacter aurantiacus]NHC46022.1 hypothetical protein [Motilibacter aurantiacus]
MPGSRQADVGPSGLWEPVTRRDRSAFHAKVREAGEPVPRTTRARAGW